VTASLSVTSTPNPKAVPPAALISATVLSPVMSCASASNSSKECRLRSATATLAPDAASRFAPPGRHGIDTFYPPGVVQLIQINDTEPRAIIVHGRRNLSLDDPQELRKLAEWYRAFAEVGNSASRRDRLELAEYLERRANELEKQAADDP
jgi:hypothetical protein